MLIYEGRYRPRGAWFWRRFKKVMGDGFEEKFGYRFFVMEDGSMVHFMPDAEVWFGKERELAIAKKMSQDAGQEVQVNRR